MTTEMPPPRVHTMARHTEIDRLTADGRADQIPPINHGRWRAIDALIDKRDRQNAVRTGVAGVAWSTVCRLL